MHGTLTQKQKSLIPHLTPLSVRLMSYVISLNVVEKVWTPTHRHCYTTVNSNHAGRLANNYAAGHYL